MNNTVRRSNSEERYNSIADHINKHILKNACDGVDSRLCLAFGTFSQEIKSYFDGFNTFKYATAVRLIGKDSGNNGFINEIEYEREAFHTEGAAGTSETDTYKSYAILKSWRPTLENPADNLMYEYRVGQYINKFIRIYPCFLETYGLLKYKTDEDWENLKSKNDEEAKAVRLTSLKEGLAIQPLDYSAACTDYHKLAILIQHFNNFTALSAILNNEDFIRTELMYVLFQLYIPLAQMKDTFTHYDLHWDNTHVYEPAPGKYIQYHYHLVPGMAPVSFKSKYMLKIIDYGSCYFKDTTEDSETIIDKICNIPNICDNKDGCGQNVGSKKHIKKDHSEDLFLFTYIKKVVQYHRKLMNHQQHLQKFLDKVEYTVEERNSVNEEMSYADFLYRLLPKKKGGTKKKRRTRVRGANSPKTTKKKRRTRIRRTNPSKTTKKMRRTRVGGAKPPNDVEKYFAENINTVKDAANHLVWNVIKDELKEKNIKDHVGENKLGDLHVYLDGTEMVFDLTNVDTET
jgi:hypothetical protein